MDESVKAYVGESLGPAQMPLLSRLKKNKEQLEQQLANVNEAIDVLERNPDFVKAYDIIGKVGNRIY